MSKPQGGSDDESAVPVEIDAPGPSESVGAAPSAVHEFGMVPMAIDLPLLMADDEASSPAADDELFARDALAAAEAGNGHVEILMCARALRADAGAGAAALTLWKTAFEREPTLLVAFWGLRRALVRRGAWTDLVGAIGRRIEALAAHGDAAAPARADLWFQRARVEEDRLRHDDEAARSLRAGLAEAPAHPGLLLSLLVLGFRRSDAVACAEALTGLLRGTLPPALRASATAWLAGLERRTADRGADAADGAGEDNGAAAARALRALQDGLRTVGPEHAAPLLDELSRLARARAAPATRAAILGEIVAQSGALQGAGQGADGARLVALQRERARLMRGELGDAAGAINVLRQAVAQAPDHPLVLAELADLLEAPRDGGGASAGPGAPGERNGAEVLRDLQDLLSRISTGSGAYASEPERELALRVVTALGRQGHAADALALLERHPELPAARPDVFALEVVLRAMLGDASGLTRAFEALAARLLASDGGGQAPSTAAAQALVVAGALAEMEEHRSAGGPVREGEALDGAGGARARGDGDPSLRLYRRAVEIAPDDRAAQEALERRLWTTGRWSNLAEVLIARVDRLDGVASARAERVRLLEDLVAVHRDLLDDPAAALLCQDHLLGELTNGAAPDQVTRAWVRRLDLEWRARDRARGPAGAPQAARTVETFRALAERAGTPGQAAAFRMAGARAAAAAGEPGEARALFTAAAPDDLSGTAAAGLERLAGAAPPLGGDGNGAPAAAADVRVAVLQDELARAEQQAPPAGVRPRARALRFRLAWHAVLARHPDSALEALAPLSADGDAVARAWSWEIARRAGDPRLALRTLQTNRDTAGGGPHPDPLRTRVDLAEALESAGDLRGAEAAFRRALEQEPSTDAALGLLRVATVRENGAAVLEATRALATVADSRTGRLLWREATMLGLLAGEAPAGESAGPPMAPGEGDDPAELVLGWMRGTRAADPLGAAGGLLALARALPTAAPVGGIDLAMDRLGLLARAAARARLGGTALAGAVHDQVQALSSGSAPIGVGLADLPMGGRPDRAAARQARAERNSGALSFALELERGLDAEARGDGRAALEGFARALARDGGDGDGIEALDGIKRLALASGDRAGAARAGTRLGMVLRTPARAAAELGMAAQLWADLGRPEEATIVFWQALARDPRSPWLFERLRELLAQRHDWTGLDLLFGHRLAALSDERMRATLLMERAQHRLGRMGDRKAAVDDLKRVLKIDPDRRAALRMLATLATEMEYFRQAVRFLDRLVGLTSDEEQAAALRLELAEAHESAREPGRAVEVLRQAVSARARDPVPWQRLIDLLLRLGDWTAALATLRSWDAIVAEPVPKAAVWLRIGILLRDQGRDLAGAATAFTTAAELDPLGDGIHALVELHERAGAHTARIQAIEGAIAAMRAALANDPMDIPHLRRLRELHEWSAARGSADDLEAATVVGQVLALAGEDVNAPATRRADSRTPFSAEFWTRIRAPGASETALAIWPHLAGGVAELSPVPKGGLPARERVAPAAEPRLAWVEAAAAAVGMPDLELALARPGTFAGDPGDTSVIPVEGGHPALVVGRGLLAGDAAARFRIGRALGLLRDRATVLDRIAAPTVASAFAAGAVVAGAPAPASVVPPVGSAVAADERARVLGRAMSRKDRKALELEASRFGFETIDAAAFQSALLGTADRLGLLFAGDVAVAARVVANPSGANRETSLPRPAPTVIRDSPRALALLRFALSQDYLTARREIGQGRADRV